MIGMLLLMYLDSERFLEFAGEEDWCAARVVFVSPLLGFGIRGEWVAMQL